MTTRTRFSDAEVQAVYETAAMERHRVHVFPHPIWDHGERVQLHVYENPLETPDFFVEFNEPLSDAFRAGLGRVLAEIAARADTPEGQAEEQATEILFEGFWMTRERIEESFMKRMLVVTHWRYITPDKTVVREGFVSLMDRDQQQGGG